MKLTGQTTLAIALSGPSDPLARVRKQFNLRMKKLDALRTRLATWKETMPVFWRELEQEYRPRAQAYAAQLRAQALLFDAMHGHKSLGKGDRTKLASLICSIAVDLLDDGDDAELKALYNRHSGGDFDAEEAEHRASQRRLVEVLCGVELDQDVAFDSPDAMLDAVDAQLRARDEAKQQEAQQRQQPDPAATRRKLRGALAREQREAAEADKLKQPLRDIFRKLTSALHPDREPDPVERARKTALMQRVNVAYGANDLLGLLTLQLEVEQIDQAGLNALSEERIKQYNKILDGQLRELGEEVGAIEYAAMQEMGEHAHHTRVTPQALLRCVRVDIAQLQARLDGITADLGAFGDVQRLKAWLKTYRLEPAYDDGGAFW